MTHLERMREIRTKHPFPWREEVHPNGMVKLFDANNIEVALFDIVALAIITTTAMSAQPMKDAA